MRLLETCLAHPDSYPLTIRSFHTADEVPYAILSHTWGHEELLYEDVVHKTGETKEGFAKILRAIRQARDDGHRYIWIDNVCINKASSAELQEAINSMFAWYSKAAICYAHLSDVKMQGSGPIPYKDIAASRWFKRGWTLQELIAPRAINFFTIDWIFLGDKRHFRNILHIATRVSHQVLSDAGYLKSACVAQKMSWAAGRETTRGEDRAYSLMGIFGVHMPLLYGEGAINAFLRLQEEIMRRSDDHSLFAWCDKNAPADQLHGLLADSPDAFDYRGADKIERDRYRYSEGPYAMTNRGLQISLTLTPKLSEVDMVYTALLHCYWDCLEPKAMELWLIKLSFRDNTFARFRCQESPYMEGFDKDSNAKTESIYIPQHANETHPKGQRQDLQVFRCTSQDSTTVEPIATPNAMLDHHELAELRLLYGDPDGEQFSGELCGIFGIRSDSFSEPCLSFSMQENAGQSIVEIRVGSFQGNLGFEVVSLPLTGPPSSAWHPDISALLGRHRWRDGKKSRFIRTTDTKMKREQNHLAPNFKFQKFGTFTRFHGCKVTVNASVSVRHGVRIHEISTVIEPMESFVTSETVRLIGKVSCEDEAETKVSSRLSLLRSRLFAR